MSAKPFFLEVSTEEVGDYYREIWITDDGKQEAEVLIDYDPRMGHKMFYVKWNDNAQTHKKRFMFLHETDEFLKSMGFKFYDLEAED